ncbi:MAG: hypothetical protein ACJ8E1_09230 [Xanthobacteraceae bacterium]|jgi:hypothetical protein
MPLLMFACPSTGRKFASGIHTDERSLASVAQMPVTLQCPLCGKTHRVTAKSGSFEEAAPARPVPRYGRNKRSPGEPGRDARAWLHAKEAGT